MSIITPRLIKVGLSFVLLAGIVLLSNVDSIRESLFRFSPDSLLLFLLLLLCNVFVVSFRFWRMLIHYGYRLPFVAVARANISGLAAGLLVISLFGQVVGRHALLKRFGLNSVAIAGLTAYERAIVTVVSALLSFVAAVFLLGQTMVDGFFEELPVAQILIVACLSVMLSFWFGRSKIEADIVRLLRSWSSILKLLELILITIVSQALLLGTFVMAFAVIAPHIEITHLMAAAAIISFSASLPISIGGWGIRELTAVFVLGQLGVAASGAIAGSVLIGLLATFAIIILTPFALKKAPEKGIEQYEISPSSEIDLEKAVAWILSMAMAVLVFFQVHVAVPLWKGVVNLNLADPFAILALAVICVTSILSRTAPAWRLKQFNSILLAISFMVLFGFLNGLFEIGMTQWAFAGRLMGWLVLIGYLAGGYLIVSYAGNHGLRRMSETMISVGVMVVFVTICVRTLQGVGWFQNLFVTQNFEGFAANRNAFALQMIVCMVLLLSYTLLRKRADMILRLRTRKKMLTGNKLRVVAFPVFLGVLVLGILLSGSRAGMLVGVVCIGFAWIFRLSDRRTVIFGLLFAFMAYGLLALPFSEHGHVQSGFSSEASNVERMKSIMIGLDMWKNDPLLGAGLGVFTETKSDQFGHMMVIHSTPVWILAEFGLLGIVVFGWCFLVLIRESFRQKNRHPAFRGMWLVLVVFGVFSLVHEIFYQRIFWLVLGALMACPGARLSDGKRLQALMPLRNRTEG